jgi:hypothetical protein
MTRFNDKIPAHLAVNPNVLFSAFMAVFQAFFITFAFLSLQLFMCYEHPNGKTSLRFSPEIECQSAAWESELAEAILMLIPVCGLAVAGLIFATAVAPKFFQNKGFQRRWKFLLIKWRPDVWWWGPVILVRSLLLCLTHTFSQEGERQLFWISAILIVYAAATAVFRPWRYWSANVMDLEISGTLIVFIALGTNFVARSGWLDDSAAHFISVFVFSPILVFICTIIWVMVRHPLSLLPPDFRSTTEQTQAAFAKFVGLDRKAAEAFVNQLSEQDTVALKRVWFMLSVQLLKDSCKSRTYKFLEKAKSEVSAAASGVRSIDGQEDDIDKEFDPGDLTTDGGVQPSKWGTNPPKGISPIPASRGLPGGSAASNRSGGTNASPRAPMTPSTNDSSQPQARAFDVTVTGAGGLGLPTNGRYMQVGEFNGKPKFKQVSGKSIIYFADSTWRINDRDDAQGWFYQAQRGYTDLSSAGKWTPIVSDGSAEPPPVIAVVPASNKAFYVGQRVRCRDGRGGEWKVGTVTQVGPLKVMPDGWGVGTAWDEVEVPTDGKLLEAPWQGGT